MLGQQFGSPLLCGERAEIDLLHPCGGAQQALREAEAFNWAILNALTVHLAARYRARALGRDGEPGAAPARGKQR